ncbi:MAG: hypothetical protein ACR2G2_12070 [Pseudonocardia sp.]
MVAVVPAPPLMVPQLTVGGAEESAAMRRACLDVVTRLGAGAARWLVLGADSVGAGAPVAESPVAGSPGRTVVAPGYGTFLGYGVDVRVSLTPDPSGEPCGDLPLPVLIAGWLRGQTCAHVRATAELVDPELGSADCQRLGERLAAGVEPGTGLLVVGDGATTHTDKAPGYLDQRAGPFDAAVARALAAADPDGLLALDAELGAELNVVGRAPWQVLAGAALAAGPGWSGELRYSDAPYGVGYHVAFWRRNR